MTPEPVIPQSPQFAEGQCSNCKTHLKLPFPAIRVFNDATVSCIAVPHPVGVECPNCDLYHNVIIFPPATQVTLALAPMEKPLINEDKKIIPFAGHLKGLT